MNKKENETKIPDDLLAELIKSAEAIKRRERQGEKDKWIALARAKFVTSERQNCYICRKWRAITQAHHIIPLSIQFEIGLTEPDGTHAWLCPNHHTILHAFLDGSISAASPNFGGLLAGFGRDELERMHELLMQSRSRG